MNKSDYSDYNHFRKQTPGFLLKPKVFESLCYAPSTKLFFDPLGYVRACCQTMTHSLGNIADARLGEIWSGSAAAGFRKSLKNQEFPAACETCRWEVEHNNFEQVFAHNFDDYNIDSVQPEWPQALWFALSNSCNLECVQCFGDISSSIRKNRDHLPPLARAYKDEFFDDLRAFLPHLSKAVFLGGEAFLCNENFRIWEMLVEDDLRPQCVIITNGTVYNKRVEQVLEQLPSSISVSLDGATAKTVESIRKNARFDDIIGNIERFKQFTVANNTAIVVSFCLMPQNHHEFADFLLLAEELGCIASTDVVYHPTRFSLAALPVNELRDVVEGLERRDAEIQRSVERNLGLWNRELARMRNWLKHPTGPPQISHDLMQIR